MRIALLHIAPKPAEVSHNKQLLESAIAIAADAGAECILTPELATTGYTFVDRIGTDWIEPQPDEWTARIAAFARRRRAAIMLALVERDNCNDTLHNSVIVIGSNGAIVGRHRKINTLRVGSEAWSTPGSDPTVVELDGFGKIGILICADACSPAYGMQMKKQGASFLFSSAAWAPGLYGPSGEWEEMSVKTGLPLFVCNRTGKDAVLDFKDAESVVVHRGERLFSMVSKRSVVFVFDWNTAREAPEGKPKRLDM
jgi:predicted amidohydrolase